MINKVEKVEKRVALLVFFFFCYFTLIDNCTGVSGGSGGGEYSVVIFRTVSAASAVVSLLSLVGRKFILMLANERHQRKTNRF